MKVKELYIYPIKSCQGISLSEAIVTQKGFFRDREFMLVNQDGIFLTQRDYPLMATIEIKIDKDIFYLSTNNNKVSELPFSPLLEGKQVKVRVWGDRTIAIDQGDEVAEWFNEVLQLSGKSKCRLVRQSDQYIREVDRAKHATFSDRKYSLKPNQPVSFADGYPFLLTATASLDDLNRRLEQKYPNQNQQVSMIRFRPNIVIETEIPFIEGTWKQIKIGKVNFRLVKPCSRCIVTTTDQVTGERNKLKEPLVTLSSFRQFKNQGVMFGENMLPENLGTIQIGDLLLQ